MIVSELFYAVKCDNCKEICEGEEYTFFTDEDLAIEQADSNDWHIDNHDKLHLCDKCHYINNQDMIVVDLLRKVEED